LSIRNKGGARCIPSASYAELEDARWILFGDQSVGMWEELIEAMPRSKINTYYARKLKGRVKEMPKEIIM
jgi:hypothetical protein